MSDKASDSKSKRNVRAPNEVRRVQIRTEPDPSPGGDPMTEEMEVEIEDNPSQPPTDVNEAEPVRENPSQIPAQSSSPTRNPGQSPSQSPKPGRSPSHTPNLGQSPNHSPNSGQSSVQLSNPGQSPSHSPKSGQSSGHLSNPGQSLGHLSNPSHSPIQTSSSGHSPSHSPNFGQSATQIPISDQSSKPTPNRGQSSRPAQNPNRQDQLPEPVPSQVQISATSRSRKPLPMEPRQPSTPPSPDPNNTRVDYSHLILAQVNKEIIFTQENPEIVRGFISIRNMTVPSNVLVFKIKTTSREKFHVYPTIGLLADRARSMSTVTLKPGILPYSINGEGFQVQVMIVPREFLGNIQNLVRLGEEDLQINLENRLADTSKDQRRNPPTVIPQGQERGGARDRRTSLAGQAGHTVTSFNELNEAWRQMEEHARNHRAPMETHYVGVVMDATINIPPPPLIPPINEESGDLGISIEACSARVQGLEAKLDMMDEFISEQFAFVQLLIYALLALIAFSSILIFFWGSGDSGSKIGLMANSGGFLSTAGEFALSTAQKGVSAIGASRGGILGSIMSNLPSFSSSPQNQGQSQGQLPIQFGPSPPPSPPPAPSPSFFSSAAQVPKPDSYVEVHNEPVFVRNLPNAPPRPPGCPMFG